MTKPIGSNPPDQTYYESQLGLQSTSPEENLIIDNYRYWHDRTMRELSGNKRDFLINQITSIAHAGIMNIRALRESGASKMEITNALVYEVNRLNSKAEETLSMLKTREERKPQAHQKPKELSNRIQSSNRGFDLPENSIK